MYSAGMPRELPVTAFTIAGAEDALGLPAAYPVIKLHG